MTIFGSNVMKLRWLSRNRLRFTADWQQSIALVEANRVNARPIFFAKLPISIVWPLYKLHLERSPESSPYSSMEKFVVTNCGSRPRDYESC